MSLGSGVLAQRLAPSGLILSFEIVHLRLGPFLYEAKWQQAPNLVVEFLAVGVCLDRFFHSEQPQAMVSSLLLVFWI